jgi:hypothetical protein
MIGQSANLPDWVHVPLLSCPTDEAFSESPLNECRERQSVPEFDRGRVALSTLDNRIWNIEGSSNEWQSPIRAIRIISMESRNSVCVCNLCAGRRRCEQPLA